MKMACIYSTKTGNTRMVAEAIHAVMPKGTELFAVEAAPAPDTFDFLSLGFWVDKGTADAKMLDYISRVSGKKVAFFGTLGAYPDSDHAKDVIKVVTQCLEGNEIFGSFLCQGKIDPNILKVMEKMPGHPMTEERIARIEEAKKHPDEQDLANARTFFIDVMQRLEKGGDVCAK